MDFFCGSGTTLIAAQELNRNWIGIDKPEQAIKIAKRKLSNREKHSFSNGEYSYLETEDNYELLKKENRKAHQCA